MYWFAFCLVYYYSTVSVLSLPASCYNGKCNVEVTHLGGVYGLDSITLSDFQTPTGTWRYKSSNGGAFLQIGLTHSNAVANLTNVHTGNTYTAVGYNVATNHSSLCVNTYDEAQQRCTTLSGQMGGIGNTFIVYPSSSICSGNGFYCDTAAIIPNLEQAYFVYAGGTPHITLGTSYYTLEDGFKSLGSGSFSNVGVVPLTDGSTIRFEVDIVQDAVYAALIESMVQLQLCTGLGHAYPGNLGDVGYSGSELYGWLRWYNGGLSYGVADLYSSFYFEMSSTSSKLVDRTPNLSTRYQAKSFYDSSTKTYRWSGCNTALMTFQFPKELRVSVNVTALGLPAVVMNGYVTDLLVTFVPGKLDVSFVGSGGNYLVTYKATSFANGTRILDHLQGIDGSWKNSYDIGYAGTLCVESSVTECYTTFMPTSITDSPTHGDTYVGTTTEPTHEKDKAQESRLKFTVGIVVLIITFIFSLTCFYCISTSCNPRCGKCCAKGSRPYTMVEH